MRKKSASSFTRIRTRRHFWRRVVSVSTSAFMITGQIPLQSVFAADRYVTVETYLESLLERDDYGQWELPEGLNLADFGGANLYYEEARIYDPQVLAEILKLRDGLIDELALSMGISKGAVGFYGEFALDDANVPINISVQFATPPVEAIRMLTESGHPASEQFAGARSDSEFLALALEGHVAFAEQLQEIQGNSLARTAAPQILSSHTALFNGVFMTVPRGMVEAIAAMPEVFVVTPEVTFEAISDVENPVVNDEDAVIGYYADEESDYFTFDYEYDFQEEALLEAELAVVDYETPSLLDGPRPTDYFMREALEVLGIADIVAQTGRQIRVGVLDTGIDYYHPAFYGSRYELNGRITQRGWDFIANRQSPMEARPGELPPFGGDAVGPTTHGTHVAGSVVAIAPDVTLYHYRVLFGSTPGHIISRGIERAFADQVDIMNLSLGTPGVNNPFAPDVYMLNLASLAGTVVVIAAGNSGANVVGSASTPGVASLPITVGNAQLGGIGFNRLDGGAYVNGQNVFMELRGNQFLFDSASIEGDFDWINLGQLANLPNAPTEAFLQNFRDEFLGGYDLTGQVAVIGRGGTTFTSMRNLVQALNGEGLIIVDNQVPSADNSLVNINTPVDGVSGANRMPIFATQLAYTGYFGQVGTTGTVSFGNVYYAELTDNMNASSSRGPVSVSYHISPDVVAPGTRIVSAVPSFYASPHEADWGNHRYAYASASGTSMAAPAVAGIVALMLEAFPEASPWEIKARLMSTARPLEGTPSAAISATNGGDFYSVLNVGAGFVRPGLAMDAGAAFATVENEIPWLAGNVPGWSRQTESALSFGNIAGSSSEELTVEIHNPGTGTWTPSISWNGSNVGASLVLLASTENTFTFQLNFEEDAEERFFEGNVIFTNGERQVTVPFGGNNGRAMAPLYVSSTHLGILRPIISGFVLAYEGQDDPREFISQTIGQTTPSNISGSLFNLQDPNHASYGVPGATGPARVTVFYAVRYNEFGVEEDYYVLGAVNVPVNAFFNLPDFVRSQMSGRNLADGVYTFYADILDSLFPFTAEIGQFVVSSARPEVRFAEEVFNFEAGEPVSIAGYIYSPGHNLAIARDVRTAAFTYNNGENPVFDYRFSLWQAAMLGSLNPVLEVDGQFDFSFTPTASMIASSLHAPFYFNTVFFEGDGPSIIANGPSDVSSNISFITPFGIQTNERDSSPGEGLPEGSFYVATSDELDFVLALNALNPGYVRHIQISSGLVFNRQTPIVLPPHTNLTIDGGNSTIEFVGGPAVVLGSVQVFPGARLELNNVTLSGVNHPPMGISNPEAAIVLPSATTILRNVTLEGFGIQSGLNVGTNSHVYAYNLTVRNGQQHGISIIGTGRLTMTGGSVYNNPIHAVNLAAGGTFTLNDGTLRAGNQQGVQIAGAGTFNMNGGTIYNAAQNGVNLAGGVATTGTFNMTGGTIHGNNHGVHVAGANNVVNITGGSIIDNRNFAIHNAGTLPTNGLVNVVNLSGGTFDGNEISTMRELNITSGNVAAAINVGSTGVLNVYEGATIGNTPGPANAPVVVAEGGVLNVAGTIARAVTVNGIINIAETGSVVAGGGGVNVAVFTVSGAVAVANVDGTIARRVDILNGAELNLNEGSTLTTGNIQFNVSNGSTANLRGFVGRTLAVTASTVNMFDTAQLTAGATGVHLRGPNNTFNMYGGTIHVSRSVGTGVTLWTDGLPGDSFGSVFNMHGGVIEPTPGTTGTPRAITESNGVGLSGRGATFNMYGGYVTGHANRGIFSNGADITVNMMGGTISDNLGEFNNFEGGAIRLTGDNPTLRIAGGNIINNSAANGGAIHISELANLYIAPEAVFSGNVAREGVVVNNGLATEFAATIRPAAVSYGTHAFNNRDIFVSESDVVEEEPEESPDYPEWNSSTVFNSGDRIIHNGRLFEAQWWTQNQEPGTSPWEAWMEVGAAVYFDGRYVPTWTDSNVFDTGDVVYYNGYFLRAQWWTRNQSPSTQWGPWEVIGVR